MTATGEASRSPGRFSSMVIILLLMILCLVATVAAVFGWYFYGREVVLSIRGDGDMALLFWYLPFLFVGIIALQGAVGSGIFVVRRSRALRHRRGADS